MEKRKDNEEANNSLVLFSALRKDIADILDFLERLENEENQKALDKDQVEKLKLELAFICTYVQLSYCNLEQFEDIMTRKRQEVENLLQPILDDEGKDIGCKYVLTSLACNMDDCISLYHRSSKSDATMMNEQLDFLLLNLYHLSKYRAEKMFPGVTQYEVLQNVCGNVRAFHGLIVNGCIKHEMVENVLPLFQLMAERVGHFLWEDQTDEDSQLSELDENDQTDEDKDDQTDEDKDDQTSEDSQLSELDENDQTDEDKDDQTDEDKDDQTYEDSQLSELNEDDQTNENAQLSEQDEDDQNDGDSRLFKLAHLLLKIVPTELEVIHICHTNMEASTSAEVGCFIKKFLETSPDILREYLIHLQEHMITVITPSTSGAQNIHVMMEFLLIILSDMPKDFIHHDKLFDLLAFVGALIKEVSTLVRDLEEKLRNKESTDETNRATLDLLENIEFLKEDLKHVYLKVPDSSQCCFPMSDGQLFMNLLHIHLNDLLDSNAYSIALIKEEIELVRQDLEFIRLFFVNVEQGLYKIFNQVSDSDSKLSENIDVADKLRKQLFGKRYLIVLDDVWDTNTWDELTRPFPDCMKGSRIILTTREKKVALHGEVNTDPLELRLLRSEESWELLEKRAFGNESCLDELLDVGKEIAENCKGLPLVADLIAGVIAGREKKKTVWLEVQNNLSSFILNSEVEVMKVIELSYDHLPHHIKPCFLYLASLPKDSAITIYAMNRLWHAEGLVEQTEMKSVEEVMKVYLDNLISSSLVIAFNEIGDYPTFQLHDLVHEFCLIKAREEKLFDQISSSTPSSSSDLMPRILTIDYDDEEEHFGLNFDLFGSNKKRHSGKHLYSLRINGDQLDDSLTDTYHLRHLRLLRVLYLDPSFINVKDSLLNEISMLSHLRYLQIRTEVEFLPLSFSNLWNLETLMVKNDETILILLPRIWDLVKLQMLLVSNCSFFDMDADESILIAEDTKLEKLKILGELILSYSKDTEDIFKRFPNLQLLQFDLKESWDYSTEQYWFPKLDFLTELEEVIVGFKSSNTNDSGSSAAINRPWDFHFPLNLKKLRLVDFRLTSNSLSTIARLPNLEELYLDRTIIHGEEWNMGEEDTFENLKLLKLHEMTLSKWEVGEESFPSLEILKLQGCHELEEIPPNLGDISSLKIIKLVESPQLENSALKIKEYAEDMRGGDELQVVGRKNILLFK